MLSYFPIFILLGLFVSLAEPELLSSEDATRLYNIEGLVLPPSVNMNAGNRWPANVRISVNEGSVLGFVRQDGYFVVSGLLPGNYVLEVQHADIHFQPVRVEITESGKIVARSISYLQPSKIRKLPYPLRLQPLEQRKYFLLRKRVNLTAYLLSPMALLILVPLLLMLLLPFLASDPETMREMENIQLPQLTNNVPDFADMLSSYLTDTLSKESKEKPKTIPRGNLKRK